MALDLGPERTLPHSLEAERSVLGSIVVHNEALDVAVQRLKPADFYRDGHRRIFQAMLRLSERRQAIDLVTLREELARSGDLESAGGTAYLAGLADGVPRSAHVDHYSAIVKDRAVLREMIAASHKVIDECYGHGEDATRILDEAERSIFAIAEDQFRGGFRSMREIAEEAATHLERLSHEHGVTGLRTGFERLDALTSGFQPSDLILIAARPSMGKTALALNIAHHAAVRDGKAVGFFSLEMSREQLYLRLLCSQARLDGHRLRTGRLSRDHWAMIGEAVEVLNTSRLFIDDTPGISVLEMRAKARRLASDQQVDLIMVDYIQLVRGRGRFENRNLELADISRSLKELAKELRVPVVALSQLSRAPEQRANRDRRPQLSDLRESGALEQDADVVLFLFRPEVYQPDDPSLENQAEVIIGKQRNGPIDTVHLVFIPEYATFQNKAPDSPGA